MEFLSVGKIVSVFGIKGEVKVFLTSSFFSKRFSKNNELLIKVDNDFEKLYVENAYIKDDKFIVVKFKNLNKIEDVEKYINKELLVEKNYDDLDENQYFYSDLEGLFVKNESFEDLGIVNKVSDFSGNISLEISYKNKNYYVPFNDFFVKKIDLENKIIVIHFIEGLI